MIDMALAHDLLRPTIMLLCVTGLGFITMGMLADYFGVTRAPS
jgi:hypothetical protein